MSGLDNSPTSLRRQYSEPSRLSTRAAGWQNGPDGSATDAALAQLGERSVRSVLEIGCGTGAFARSVQAVVGADVIATDASEGMVAAAAAAGVRAERADADDLPYPDASFDAVCALWMLYHVPDLRSAFREVVRVLRPGGTFLAVTNGTGHTASLRAAAGLGPAVLSFSRENGAAWLRNYFDDVQRQDFRSWMDLDHAQAVAYVATFDPQAAERIAPFEGRRRYDGATSLFIASSRTERTT